MNDNLFAQYQLDENLINILKKIGYRKMTPIQEAVIPLILKNENIIARAETGTGKSHAYLIPLIQRAIGKSSLTSIIIVPSRELAKQTYRFANEIAEQLSNIKIRLIIGGRQKEIDEEKMISVPQILIITPGRLNELLKTTFHRLLIETATIVLDEVDMLINDGFFSFIESFLQLWQGKQLLTFSASMPKNLTPLVKKYASAIKIIDVSDRHLTSKLVNHYLIDIHHRDINDMVMEFINIKRPYLLLIFASKIETVINIHHHLLSNNLIAAIIHGDMPMRQRVAMMRRIKANEFPIIVASDLAARGIDILDVSDVLSVDFPSRDEYYLHRAGRTGRNQKKGDSFLFYNKEEINKIANYETKGIQFDYLSLKEGKLQEVKKSRFASKHSDNDKSLISKPKKIILQSKQTKIKPRYKQKISQARKKRQQTNKRKIYKNNKVKNDRK